MFKQRDEMLKVSLIIFSVHESAEIVFNGVHVRVKWQTEN